MENAKSNIKRTMNAQGISIKILSKRSNISTCKLFLLLYCPFSKIKLSQFMYISRSLKIRMSDLL
jgi:hypothetical protein